MAYDIIQCFNELPLISQFMTGVALTASFGAGIGYLVGRRGEVVYERKNRSCSSDLASNLNYTSNCALGTEESFDFFRAVAEYSVSGGGTHGNERV